VCCVFSFFDTTWLDIGWDGLGLGSVDPSLDSWGHGDCCALHSRVASDTAEIRNKSGMHVLEACLALGYCTCLPHPWLRWNFGVGEPAQTKTEIGPGAARVVQSGRLRCSSGAARERHGSGVIGSGPTRKQGERDLAARFKIDKRQLRARNCSRPGAGEPEGCVGSKSHANKGRGQGVHITM